MPLPGDVDVVLASELMEAGRAVQRGLVTRDRTTLIASTHRVYSIAEKTRAWATAVSTARSSSRMRTAPPSASCASTWRRPPRQAGSVISAVLFGALAGTGVLPFSRAQFEATVERGGVGVKPSLKAFGAAFERAQSGADDTPTRRLQRRPSRRLGAHASRRCARWSSACSSEFPASAQPPAVRRRAPPDRLPGSGLCRHSTSIA